MKTNLKNSTKELRTLSRLYLLEGLFIAGMFHCALIGGVKALMRHMNIDETIPTIVIDRPIDWIPVTVSTAPQKPAPITPVPQPNVFVNNAEPNIVPDFIEKAIDTMKYADPIVTSSGEPGQGEPFAGSTSMVGSFIAGGSDEGEPEPFVAVQKEPVPIVNPTPAYPDLAQKAGVEGTVFVKMWVTKDGTIKRAEVLKSTSSLFEKEAVETALRWKFSPAIMNNGPVSVWVTVPFRFRLNSK
ncbi:MAG: energy transducer TonB [Bacteroidota bacterium]